MPAAECVLWQNGWMPHISRCKGIQSVSHYSGMRSNFIPEFSQLMRLKSKLSVPNSVPLGFCSMRCNAHPHHPLDHREHLLFPVTPKTFSCLLERVVPEHIAPSGAYLTPTVPPQAGKHQHWWIFRGVARVPDSNIANDAFPRVI